jgi:Peptidase family M23
MYQMLKTVALITVVMFLISFKSHKAYYPDRYKNIGTSNVVSISILPANPLLEKDQYGQYLNFDIIIKNTDNRILVLSAIEVSVMDPNTKLVLKKSINSNGQSPGIETVGNTVIKPGETIDIFNPFYSFAPDVNIAYMKYEFFFNYSDNGLTNKHRLPTDFDVSMEKMITPEVYHAKTNFSLPLKGRLIVWDGHDFYSHHRRFPLGSPELLAKGITANSNRYAYDLASIDEKGNMYQNDPFKKVNWYVFGKPVYAPAGGRIIEMQNDIPDNEFSGKTVQSPNTPANIDPLGMGNHVIIDHGNGEFSVMLHMEKGTIKVKTGEIIKEGQQIGNIGFSGDAIFPHLHYTVMNGSKESISEGVPSYFGDYKLFRGNSFILIKKGRIDSGDIIESEK